MEINVNDVLKATGFRFNKALGQNFITDVNLLDAIVSDSGVTANDTVVEIGTGAGTLTRRLAKTAAKVLSFEVDKSLAETLDVTLQGLDNVEVIFRDVLKTRPAQFKEILGDSPFKVVANLPYYITTPLIMYFLENEFDVDSLTVMVQKEVAERLVAECGTKNYSAVTLAVEMRGNAVITRKVPREVFFPTPNVDSAVVRIDLDRDKLAGENKPFIATLIRAAFSMRRKTLANNLASALSIPKSEIENKLTECGFAAMIRGEALTLNDFITLSRKF